jgi:hypothetical protein
MDFNREEAEKQRRMMEGSPPTPRYGLFLSDTDPEILTSTIKDTFKRLHFDPFSNSGGKEMLLGKGRPQSRIRN